MIYILAESPLASSGFAAIVCYRASPYDGVYIMKNYTKLNAEKSDKIETAKLSYSCFPERPDPESKFCVA